MTRRSNLLIAAAIAVGLALLATLALRPGPGGEPMKLIDQPKELAQVPSRGPDDWIVAQRADPDSEKIPFGAFEKAADETDALAALARRRAPALAKAKWKLEGPRQVGGRVVDIAVDPNELNTVYAAVATGGVWKSVDAGLTFKPAWPRGATLSMGALAIASDGTLYAGTGEANPGGGSIVYGGSGVFKSTNGGKTWKKVGLARSGAIGRIMVDPSDPKKVYVAASGPLFQRGGQRGLYLTKNAGGSWTRVLKGANATTGAVDLAIDPENSDIVYVSMWDHIRTPAVRIYGGTGSGLYRSTNGAKSFKRLGSQQGLPVPSKDVGRIGVAIGDLPGPLPNPVYTIYIQTDGFFSDFYSDLTDGGDSFSASPADVALTQSQSSYGWWFGRIWVDPTDPLHVFAGGLFLGESVDGGQSFAIQAANVHPDHHAMAWDPQVPNRVYLGNDGGFYMSPSNGTPEASWVASTHMPWTQFYSVSVSQQDRTRVIGGAQDNGSLRSYGLPNDDPFGCASWINCGDWNNYYGGDGEQNLINPKDQTNVFACFQYGDCARSTDGGDNMTSFTGQTQSSRRNWFTPLEFDPNNPQIMYYGGDAVNRSTDNGQTWSLVSPPLMKKPSPDPQYPYNTLTTIAISKKQPKTLLVGSDSGHVWRTTNLKKWRRLRDDDLPRRWVTRLAIHPEKKNVMYASFSGYRHNEDDPHVSISKDGGDSWKDISRRLPDAPVNDVFPKGKALYVATDVGVFVTKNNGRRWLRVGKGLPIAPITDLTLHKKSKSLFASTFGRGMYSVKLPKGF
jgi:photosystem II stability/assembly factor-like uncharacterized protein